MTPYLNYLHRKHLERKKRLWFIPSKSKPIPVATIESIAEPIPQPQLIQESVQVVVVPEQINPGDESLPPPPIKKSLTILDIQKSVAFASGCITVKDILGCCRVSFVARHRQISFYLSKTLMPHLSYPAIGRRHGGKDYTTMLYGCRKISSLRPGIDQVLNKVLDCLRDRGFIVPDSAADLLPYEAFHSTKSKQCAVLDDPTMTRKGWGNSNDDQY